MKTLILGLVWMVLGVAGPGAWGGEPAGTDVWLTLERVDGQELRAEVLAFGEKYVKVRTKNGKVQEIGFEELSERTRVTLEQLEQVVVGADRWEGSDPLVWDLRTVRKVREARVKEMGGSLKSEQAVAQALLWLKKTQGENGSWGDRQKTAMTGLALLCFSGRGESPLSEEFGESYTMGVAYLVDVGVRNKGKFADNLGDKHWPYEHAIATEALVEAWAICDLLNVNFPDLKKVTRSAAQWIIDNQHESGGWDYHYTEQGPRGGDLSITSWHVNALAAAREAGLTLRNLGDCFEAAEKYVRQRQASNGGFGYSGTKPVGNTDGFYTLTGAGMRALQICSAEEDPAVRKGAEYLRKKARFDYDAGPCDLYSLYFNCRALAKVGGEDWTTYQELWRKSLMAHRLPDGAWKIPGGGEKQVTAGVGMPQDDSAFAKHYRTCLATLILESYYR